MDEEAFDTDVKMMATVHEQDGGPYRVAVKGAPEAVLDAATHEATADGKEELDDEARARWHERNEAMAADGLRILALAQKTVDDPGAPPYEGLTLLALVGLYDPPRDDVQPAIEMCRGAGIEVVMITGDQPVTARGIGKAVGLVDRDDAPVVHGSDMKPPTRRVTRSDTSASTRASLPAPPRGRSWTSSSCTSGRAASWP